jgi:hypothetical protein
VKKAVAPDFTVITVEQTQGGKMNIEYVRPLSLGWERMKKALFRPFDLRKWLVVGFTAFLAGALDSAGGGGSGRGSSRFNVENWDEVFSTPSEIRYWLAGHPTAAAFIFMGAVAIVVLIIVFTWLSSRGKFMFLDNVARNKDNVTAPWYEFRPQGNSLFGMRLGLVVVTMAAFTGYLAYSYFFLRGCYNGGQSARMLTMNAVTLGVGLFVLVLIAGFISICIDDFIVPIMGKRRSVVMPALREFWNLFKMHPGDFLLYALMVFFLKIGVVILIVTACFATCCVGFLPVSYTYRAFSLEFLRQFGKNYDLFSTGSNTKTLRAAKSAVRKKNTGRRS